MRVLERERVGEGGRGWEMVGERERVGEKGGEGGERGGKGERYI